MDHRQEAKRKGRKTHYLVKWKGYPTSDNSWEPAEHLHADELIREYEEEQQETRTNKKKKKIKDEPVSETNQSPSPRFSTPPIYFFNIPPYTFAQRCLLLTSGALTVRGAKPLTTTTYTSISTGELSIVQHQRPTGRRPSAS